MSFLLNCPNCGSRSVNDYRYGGEVTARPSPGDSEETWSAYFYVRKNVAGLQREWWYHKYGCRRWFQAERNTLNNEVSATFWPGEGPGQSSGGGG